METFLKDAAEEHHFSMCVTHSNLAVVAKRNARKVMPLYLSLDTWTLIVPKWRMS